jgi:hypothetical protein
MRALKGFVEGTNAGSLCIRLNNGSKLSYPEREDILYGDTIYLLWDYTANRARDIWTEQQYHAGDTVPFECDHDLTYPSDRLTPEEFGDEMDEEIGFGFGDFS